MRGNLIIVSAPSGAGKTTIVGEALKRDHQVRPSVSYTSRAPRADETNGVHYHFILREEFDAMIARGDFLEWAEVHGRLYGTSRRQVEDLRAEGFDVILTIDVQGAAAARAIYPEAVSVFILPPAFETMVERLNVRGANHTDDLQVRLKNARAEIAESNNFDYIVINDDLDHAVGELASIIVAERCRRIRRYATIEQILKTFHS